MSLSSQNSCDAIFFFYTAEPRYLELADYEYRLSRSEKLVPVLT